MELTAVSLYLRAPRVCRCQTLEGLFDALCIRPVADILQNPLFYMPSEHCANGRSQVVLTVFSIAGLMVMTPTKSEGASGTCNVAAKLVIVALYDCFPIAHHAVPIC